MCSVVFDPMMRWLAVYDETFVEVYTMEANPFLIVSKRLPFRSSHGCSMTSDGRFVYVPSERMDEMFGVDICSEETNILPYTGVTLPYWIRCWDWNEDRDPVERTVCTSLDSWASASKYDLTTHCTGIPDPFRVLSVEDLPLRNKKKVAMYDARTGELETMFTLSI